MTPPPKIKRGIPAQKWPFFQTLKVGFFHEEADPTKHDALRTAASRAGKGKKKFKVRKELVSQLGNGETEVIRVYRTK